MKLYCHDMFELLNNSRFKNMGKKLNHLKSVLSSTSIE